MRRLQANSQKGRKASESHGFWQSYSDIMAALLLSFVLLLTSTMLKANIEIDALKNDLDEKELILDEKERALIAAEKLLYEKQKQLDSILGIRKEIIEALKKEFEGSDLGISIDERTGAITFESDLLFDYKEWKLKDSGKEFMDNFLPRYISVILHEKYREYISEIIVEGHTDTVGGYIYNLELSQKRSLEVAKYFLSDDNGVFDTDETEQLREIVTANGRSFSEPIYYEDGSINADASRRVEIKFHLEDEELIQEVINMINMDEENVK